MIWAEKLNYRKGLLKNKQDPKGAPVLLKDQPWGDFVIKQRSTEGVGMKSFLSSKPWVINFVF